MRILNLTNPVRGLDSKKASYLLARLERFFFGFGVKGCGGVLSIRRSTSSGLGARSGFDFDKYISNAANAACDLSFGSVGAFMVEGV